MKKEESKNLKDVSIKGNGYAEILLNLHTERHVIESRAASRKNNTDYGIFF